MSQTSKIMEGRANAILTDIFKAGNILALLKGDPNAHDYSKPIAPSYNNYVIQSGDFVAEDGAITTARHLLFGLATEEWASTSEPIKAFGVYANGTIIYWGMLTTPVAIPADTVPVFKVYNKEKGEGIKVTLDVVATASASS